MKIIIIFTTIFNSLQRDFQLLVNVFPTNLQNKIDIIINKYFLFLKHTIFKIPLTFGKAKISLQQQNHYYDSAKSIANLQLHCLLTPNLSKLIKHIKAPTIIDVGAHIGNFSISMSYLLHNPLIYACEPLSLTYKLLYKNTAKIKSIKTFQIGFSDRNKKSTIYFDKNSLICSSIFKNKILTPNPQSETIQLLTLDEFINNNSIKNIDILKIDAEGSEEMILKGTTDTLKKTHFLYIEYSTQNSTNSTFSSFINQLYSQKYSFQLLNIENITYDSKGAIIFADLLLQNVKFKRK